MGTHESHEESDTGRGAHEAPEPDEPTGRTIAEVLGSPRFWLAPLVLVAVLFSLMAALYMSAVVDPQKHLHDFPIALVNEDAGGEVSGADGEATRQNIGDRIAAGIAETATANGFDVRRTDRSTAFGELNSGKVYGVVVIGQNFTNRVAALGRSTALTYAPARPEIDVYINRGSGAFASSITTTFAEQMSERVNAQVGEQLTAEVRDQLEMNDITFTGAAKLAVGSPVDVSVSEPTPLPRGAGNGLSAFYLTLLLVLAGFTGAMMVSIVVDGMLGQTPIEYGPFYQLRERLPISRWATLAAKWVIMLLVAVVLSTVFVGVGALVGTSLPNAFVLWLISILGIFAVGVSASAMMAVFGNAGLLFNLIFFVVFGLPSSGGTLPLEASPRFFEWVAAVEPMHVIYLGVRSVLYFDADMSAGLARSVIQCFVGLLLGALLGALGTKFYDRKGWHRYPGGMTLPPKLDKIVNAG
ncbi:YhgE/Pip domain-containing protein [Gordonia aurantiaca]|uniref:YhgE/Pip domain-containing protein n=1 Tax=Gordonia sp. B21 TaxID=3151852 RepID=UPI003262E28E